MKKLVLFIAFIITAYYTNAQVMAAKPAWVTIKSANLKCWECKDKLEKYMTVENKATFESGIIKWTINLPAGEIRLQYYPDRITPDDIRLIMNNAGFDADSTKATVDVYNKLPPACKRTEDGGGPQKGKPCHIQPY
jgi:hypothetical protein